MDSDLNPVPIYFNNYLQTNKCLKKNENKNKNENWLHITVQPNFEMLGGPNPPPPHHHHQQKIFLNNFEYNLVRKHVEHSDQQMGARHPMLCNKDVEYSLCRLLEVNNMNRNLSKHRSGYRKKKCEPKYRDGCIS